MAIHHVDEALEVLGSSPPVGEMLILATNTKATADYRSPWLVEWYIRGKWRLWSALVLSLDNMDKALKYGASVKRQFPHRTFRLRNRITKDIIMCDILV